MAIAGALIPSALAVKKPTVLDGTLGPGFTIAIDNSRGKPVTTVPPGRYELIVHDRSAFLDFHLFGKGVNKRTTVTGTPTVHWLVTLKPGIYHYQCDAHATIVSGVLRVT